MYSKAYVRVEDGYEEIRGLVFHDKELCVMYHHAGDDKKLKKLKRKISLPFCIPFDSTEIISEKDYFHKKIKIKSKKE
jgi:hypothetical protein